METKKIKDKRFSLWRDILLGLIFVIAGTISIVYFSSNIISDDKDSKTFIETTATVVDHIVSYGENGASTSAIIVKYTVDGKSYQKSSNHYFSSPKSIGSNVSIKYNPNDPKEIIWVNDNTNISFLIVGVLFAIVGIIVIVKSIIERNKSEEDGEDEEYKE